MLSLVALCLAALLASAQASNGHIYALSLNGTTNLANLLIADLDTYIVAAGPPLPGIRPIGQAAAVSPDGSTFFAFAIVSTASGEGTFLLTLSTATGAVLALTNTSTWPGSNGTHLFVDDLFAQPEGGLLALARPLGPASPPHQLLLRIAGASASLLGAVPESGGDCAWDAAGSLLYEVLPGANDEDSGSLATVSTGPGTPRVLGTPLPLQAHFGFPQWSAARGALVGLSLYAGGPNGYSRNVTLLNPKTGELTDLGGLGDDFVVLEDGPKALSASGNTAYFMLASGPFAEFDVVAVDISGAAVVKETVGLCGFVGYCPEGFALGP